MVFDSIIWKILSGISTIVMLCFLIHYVFITNAYKKTIKDQAARIEIYIQNESILIAKNDNTRSQLHICETTLKELSADNKNYNEIMQQADNSLKNNKKEITDNYFIRKADIANKETLEAIEYMVYDFLGGSDVK